MLFQRIVRRDKKAFLDDQRKEIEENNRMGKIRDLFKKVRDTKGTFHAKMGSIKGRNGMHLTEAEDIKRGGKNTQKNCTKKIFMTKIITMVSDHTIVIILVVNIFFVQFFRVFSPPLLNIFCFV